MKKIVDVRFFVTLPSVILIKQIYRNSKKSKDYGLCNY